MSERDTVMLRVNDTAVETVVEPFFTLLTVLRDQLGLTGAKRGCNQGVCGACTVLSDGLPIRSCLCLGLDCEDKHIETIEGLSEHHPVMQALQRAFIAAGAFQCGYCTPGMLVAAFVLLQNNPHPSSMEVSQFLSGNLCRCTGYKKIVDAVLKAAAALVAEPMA